MTTKTDDKYGLLNLAEFVIAVESFNSNIDIRVIKRAFVFGEKAHAGQKRRSGDPFFLHSIQTALTLAEQHLDSATIAAGLLHDVVEDTDVTLQQVEAEFGSEIAGLVEGVTKISTFQAQSIVESQAENFRKMILSMAHDIRVILIKLADRLHNMRTLDYMSPDAQQRISRETFDVYAPLANRLGIAKLKWELEDLSMKYLEPEKYRFIQRKIAETLEDRETYINETINPIKTLFAKMGLKAKIYGRVKSISSIFHKMSEKNLNFAQIVSNPWKSVCWVRMCRFTIANIV